MVNVSSGPRLGEIKVRIAANSISRKIGMSQESALAVKGRAVSMEPICEGQHDVGVLVHFASDLAVGDFPEG